MNRLYIDDLSKLQITKIKPWVVNFRYNGEYYVLHGESEIGEGSWQTLYHKIIENDRTIEMIPIGHTVMAGENVEYDYFSYRRHKEYKLIDKEDFVRKMTAFGIVNSIYSNELNRLKKAIDDTSTKLRFVSELQTMLQRGLTHDIEHYVEILGIKCEKSESKNKEEMLRDLRLLYSDLQNELYKLNTTYRGKQRN